MLDFADLAIPVVQAPMAGGCSTASLAAAVSNAGGLGFLAAGYKSATYMADDIVATRRLTARPFGVNVFVPRPSLAVAGELLRYRRELHTDADRYRVEVGPTHHDDDDWDRKIGLLVRARPAAVSFTFGLPSSHVVRRLKHAGILVISTITTVEEAVAAARIRVDVLCVQGPKAGGHRGTFDPGAVPSDQGLDELITDIRGAVGVPLVAAGGLSDREDIQRVLGLGAIAAQVGTGFLRCDEAGTKQAHKDAMVSRTSAGTALTRAFSGRFARGIRNRFMTDHDASAPFGYPEVHQMTSPIRAAAAAAGDAERMNLWAGTGYPSASDGSAASILAALAPAASRP